MDNSILLIILLIVLLGFGGVLFFFLQKRLASREDSTNMLNMLQRQVFELQNQMMQTLASNTKSMNDELERIRNNVGVTLTETSKLLNENIRTINEQLGRVNASLTGGLAETKNTVIDVAKKLGELEESNKKIYEVGKDISSLQSILQAPKLRGVLGELFLGDLLAQMLPSQYYSLQYQFKNGTIVDATIRLHLNKLVCVDSKFPLESFRRYLNAVGEEAKKVSRRQFVNDVKKHVDTIAEKYILPDEGTFDFALMYIPAENVYYETIIKDEEFGEEKSISAYALSRRVIPVSPNSFYAYLQAIVLGLKGMEVEKSAQEILANLTRLRGELDKFRENFELIGKHLSNVRANYEAAEKRLERFGEKLGEVDKTKEPFQLPS